MKLINQGEYLKAPEKKYEEVIVFVPFFFGKKKKLRKHADFVNSLGFDCVVFNLTDDMEKGLPKTLAKVFQNIKHGWGLKNLWAEEITEILNAVPGNKIIYAFSSPSTSALKSIVKRQAKDIRGLVCDSGPFYDLIQGYWKYFTHEHPIKNIFLKVGINAITRSFWGIQHEKDLNEYFNKLPKNFPVLSIRGWKDPLVSLTSIEKAFADHNQIDLEILNLPEGKHLDGLKNFSEIYKPRVGDFLIGISRKI